MTTDESQIIIDFMNNPGWKLIKRDLDKRKNILLHKVINGIIKEREQMIGRVKELDMLFNKLNEYKNYAIKKDQKGNNK